MTSVSSPRSGGDLVQIAFSSLSTKTGFVASTKGDILAITSDSITPLHPLQFSPNYLVASPDGQSVAAIQVDKINIIRLCINIWILTLFFYFSQF